MSGFGNTSFGAAPQVAKPLGNFTFGGGNTSFGAAPTAAPAFGAAAATPFGTATSTGFGAANPAPAFGAANPAPAFGATVATGFGTSGGTGFGGTSTTPAFGAAGTTSAFGTSGVPAFGAATPGTGLGGGTPFGTTTNTGPSFGTSLFGTNTNTSTTTQAFSFGGGTFTSGAAGNTTGFGGSLFGQTNTQPTTSTTGFGGFGTGGTSFGGFGGTATSTAPPLFGGNTGFGGGASGFGGFGKPQTVFSLNGQQPQQQQAELPSNPDVNVQIYNDERDIIIARFNHLQGLWGTGKSYYSPNAPPIEITSHNYLNRFKTMAYCKLPKKDNKMGLVAIIFNKNQSELKNQEQQLISQLQQIFGNKPGLVINIEEMKVIPDNKCKVVIYIEEKSQTSNEIKKYSSTEVSNYLNQQMPKQQLCSLGADRIIPILPPDEDQLKEYLENTPKGIDPRMWRQAQFDNPDPQKFIPVPIIGYSELKSRMECQEAETEMHSLYLKKVERDLNELKQRHLNSAAKIVEHKRKIAKLSHDILKIIVKLEVTRKIDEALLPEEELIRSKLESIQSLIITPNEFKGRLNELVAQMKIHLNQWYDTRTMNEYKLDNESSSEMSVFLAQQQKAISVLVETVNKDMRALKTISEGITQLTPMKH